MLSRYISFATIALLFGIIIPCDGYALSYRAGDFNFKLSGYGTAGFIEPDFDKPDFVGDFSVRGEVAYRSSEKQTFGLVYAYDEDALHEDDWKSDAFGYWYWRGIGRIELGFTESVAHKLGLGLPDVGGLRLNDDSLVYRKMGVDGPVIANTVVTTDSDALHLNIVSASNPHTQYGLSVSGLTDEYDAAVDLGFKLRYSEGKTKYALSLAASFMNNLDKYSTDTFTPDTTADWRGQFAAGLNIQYNSLVFALTGRIIYDENPIGVATDGFVIGTGASYDLLNYTLSLSYLFSDTGVWHHDFDNYIDNTVVGSFRYKYSEYVDGWTSIGVSRKNPFLAVGLRATF